MLDGLAEKVAQLHRHRFPEGVHFRCSLALAPRPQLLAEPLEQDGLLKRSGVQQQFIDGFHADLAASGIRGVRVDLTTEGLGGYYSEHPMVLLSYIEVPRRRRSRGIGSAVMQMLTKRADAMGIALGLAAAVLLEILLKKSPVVVEAGEEPGGVAGNRPDPLRELDP